MTGVGRIPLDHQKVEAVLDRGTRGRGTRRWLVIGLAAAVIGLGAVWWSVSSRSGGVHYRTETASVGDIVISVTATGNVEPTRVVEVSSELSGIIEDVFADFNDIVRSGDLLASLNTDELEAGLALARANLSARESDAALAQVNLDEARVVHERTVQLSQRNIVSSRELDSAAAGLHRAEAALASAQAGVDVALAELDRAQTLFDKSCICAPIDGMVLERNVAAGQIVAASLQAPVLFRIAQDLSQMELHVDIDEADVGLVQEGDTATFTVEAFRDLSFPATITQLRFAPRIASGVVSYQAVLSISNDELLLRPGMTATADIIVDRLDNTLRVPNAALRYSPERESIFAPAPVSGVEQTSRTVWVLRDGQATPIDIVAGPTDGTFTAVQSGSIAEGEAVIVGED